MKRKVFLMLVPALALVLVELGSRIHAAPPTPESPTLPPPREREAIPYLGTGAEPVVAMQPQKEVAITAVADWSKIVFQSYRDNNWEIYIANGDGTNQTRLTWNDAIDMQPRLNRGCTRIVFASRRTGNYEIFTMNADGSGLVQLTYNNTDDVNPTWSPDGTKIAFQTYRDGQAEVYIMNADGSGQSRLTQDRGYDGEPTWSPDGTKIAFVSNRAGGYHIWVMNANGSGQTQRSTQAYSANPTWSPDGNRIAYDADGNNDGWQELWLMNAEGSNQRQVYVPFQFQTDAWAGSWSPDGRYVAFTLISFVYHQDNWYWTYAYLAAWDSVTRSITRLSSQGADWNIDWQTSDAQAPVSSISALPPYLSIHDPVRWKGRDTGGAGIAFYTVQYREEPGGVWTTWLNTPDTSGIFNGTIGRTYTFRVKARDNAFNEGRWSPERSATLYERILEGRVTDNRGFPIVHGNVDIQPIPVLTGGTDFDGRYSAYLSARGTHTVTVSQPGFGSARPQRLKIQHDTRGVLSVLPPADNVVSNGGFESGDLTGWTAQGAYTPSIGLGGAHSGNSGLSKGRLLSVSDPITVNLPGDYVAAIQTRDGSLHAISLDGDVLYYSTSSDGIVWTSPERIASPVISARFMRPVIATGGEGSVHIVFAQVVENTFRYMYLTKLTDGGWSTPQVIGCVPYATLTVHPWGKIVHIIFENGRDIFHCSRSENGTWSEAYQLSYMQQGVGGWSATVDQQGTLHVLWSGTGFTEYADFGVAYTFRSVNGVWSTPIRLTTERNTYPHITVDAQGNLYAIWCTIPSGDVKLRRRAFDPHAVWYAPEIITTGLLWRPKLFIRSDGVQYFVYETGTGTHLLARRAGGVWSKPVRLGANDGYPLLVDNGIAFFSAGSRISYRRVPWVSNQTTSLSQSIFIPITMTSPTLSFLYRLQTLQGTSPGGLTVRIVDKPHETTIWSSGSDTGLIWHQGWADLSNWRGKMITVTFVLSEVAGTDSLYLDLDEITVGSWNTPVIDAIEPTRVEANVPFTMTITGRNFVRQESGSNRVLPQVLIGNSRYTDVTWINTATLSVSVTGMSPGIYRVAVSNPNGQTGSGTVTLRVGHVLWLPLIARED